MRNVVYVYAFHQLIQKASNAVNVTALDVYLSEHSMQCNAAAGPQLTIQWPLNTQAVLGSSWKHIQASLIRLLRKFRNPCVLTVL